MHSQIKAIAATLLAVSTTLTVCVSAQPTEETASIVSTAAMSDTVLLARALVEDITAAEAMRFPLDLDGNGLLTANDLHLLLRVLTGQLDADAVRAEIRQMIRDHVDAPGDQTLRQKHLRIVSLYDPALADTWSRIMAYWDYVNSEMPIQYGALPDGLDNTGALCLTVLGYQLNADGSLQPELVSRLTTMLACARQYPNAYILCTGGGTALLHPELTEAGQMAQWLIDHGIAPERIIVEDQSMTTAQNAYLSFDIFTQEHPEITQIAIISSDYHIAWGSLMFEARGLLADGRITVVANAACRTGQTFPEMLTMQSWGLGELLQLTGPQNDLP